jgi:hypothetical protein
MERALDDVAIEPSVTQERIGVSADIVSGINLPVYVVQCDIEVTSLDANNFSGLDSILVCNSIQFSELLIYVFQSTSRDQRRTAVSCRLIPAEAYRSTGFG